ncbi:STAS domain-containing protein [Streptomyces sp. NPDC018019]|uniref:STAS domain-containing protein n=1 Tax=Streptomyces sp. NPDC018019 TaxID=3365030 RepID=UPI0037BB21DB
MTDPAHPAPMPRPPVAFTITGDLAVLAFSGELHTDALRQLEVELLSQRLREAPEWVLEMSELTHIDLACAYALLRALPPTGNYPAHHPRRTTQPATAPAPRRSGRPHHDRGMTPAHQRGRA